MSKKDCWECSVPPCHLAKKFLWSSKRPVGPRVGFFFATPCLPLSVELSQQVKRLLLLCVSCDQVWSSQWMSFTTTACRSSRRGMSSHSSCRRIPATNTCTQSHIFCLAFVYHLSYILTLLTLKLCKLSTACTSSYSPSARLSAIKCD